MKITLTHSLIFSVLIFCLPTLLTAQVVVDFEDVDLSMPDSFIASSFESGGLLSVGRSLTMEFTKAMLQAMQR